MKTEIKESKFVTYKRKITCCDDCGALIKHDLVCSVAKCEICDADLCEKCIGLELPTMGDYREVYCYGCHILIKDNNEKILKLRDEADKLEEYLFDDCKKQRDEKTKERINEQNKEK